MSAPGSGAKEKCFRANSFAHTATSGRDDVEERIDRLSLHDLRLSDVQIAWDGRLDDRAVNPQWRASPHELEISTSISPNLLMSTYFVPC
jgi:hypothetical protein